MAAMLSARVSAPAALRRVAARSVRCAAVTSASAGKEYMESLPGVSAPMGFFDPLGFCNGPAFTVSEAKRFREAEVTHGRVSMLAAIGWLVRAFALCCAPHTPARRAARARGGGGGGLPGRARGARRARQLGRGRVRRTAAAEKRNRAWRAARSFMKEQTRFR
jgi:hypothetical protein